jgi:hypothetical protein
VTRPAKSDSWHWAQFAVAGRTDPHLPEFLGETFEVRSRSGCALAGIDGEALALDTPLEFRIHPRELRMLVPADVVEESERRRARGYGPGFA